MTPLKEPRLESRLLMVPMRLSAGVSPVLHVSDVRLLVDLPFFL